MFGVDELRARLALVEQRVETLGKDLAWYNRHHWERADELECDLARLRAARERDGWPEAFRASEV